MTMEARESPQARPRGFGYTDRTMQTLLANDIYSIQSEQLLVKGLAQGSNIVNLAVMKTEP